MEFKTLKRLTVTAPPSLKVTKQGARLTIPAKLASETGIESAEAVSLEYGSAGRVRCIRVVPNPSGPYKLATRHNARVLVCQELLPKNADPASASNDLEFEKTEQGLVLTLPATWQLARPELAA